MSAQQRYAGLDGLKGLAIAAIVLYHMNALGGGFIGVDVFFALSGYLTSGSLRRRLEPREGRGAAVGGFYRSRLRRLYPSVLVVTCATVCLSWLFCRQALYGSGRQILGALTFTYNWVDIAEGSSYFAGESPEPLKHLWYVALLGQFLLVAPLIALLARRAPKAAPFALLALAVASGAEMGVLYDAGDPTRVYFGTDTHAYPLLAGMALGWADGTGACRRVRESAAWRRAAPSLGAVALAALLAACVLVRQDAFAFRGGLAGVTVCALLLVGVLTGEGSWFSRALSWRPLAFLGRHSYGVYLWHYPLFVIASAAWPAHTAPGRVGQGVAVLALTALAAWAVHTFIDAPVASGGFLRPFLSRAAWAGGGALRCAVTISVVAALVLASAVAVWVSPSMTRTQAVLEADSVLLAHSRTLAASSPAPSASTGGQDDEGTLAQSLSDAFSAQIASDTALSDEAIDAMRQAALQESDEERRQAGLQAAQDAQDARTAAQEKARQQAEAERRLAEQSALPVSDAMPDGSQMTMIGDSVMLGASPSILSKFPGAYIDAAVSRHFTTAFDIVNQARDAGNLRKWVVVGLGTNGTVTADNLATLDQTVGEGHVIVLVTAYADRSWIAPSNQAVTEYVASHADHVLVADWCTAIGLHTDLLYADGFHPTEPEGGDLYAQTLYNAINTWVTEQSAAGTGK